MSREEADQMIRRLHDMSTNELRQLWALLFNMECYTNRKAFIRRRLEWRINTLVSGGISERAMKRAEEIADDTLLRVKSRVFTEREAPKRVEPTQIIRKEYKGQLFEVYCTAAGFCYDGKIYKTLSEVSTLIAGYYISGNHFFKLPMKPRFAPER